MQIQAGIKFSTLLVMAAFSASGWVARAQHTAPVLKEPHHELALDYSFLRSNAPPDSCTCFNLNGGSAAFAWQMGQSRFALVGDVGIAHASNISSGGFDLTLSTFTGGARYHVGSASAHLRPFGQVLAGFAHSSGSLVSGSDAAVSNAGAAFAAIAGGGIDLRLSQRISIRMIEADYLATTLKNGVNDHQNNLRLNAGLVIHF